MTKESYPSYVPGAGRGRESEDTQYLAYEPTNANGPLLNGEPITQQDVDDRRERLRSVSEERDRMRKIARTAAES